MTENYIICEVGWEYDDETYNEAGICDLVRSYTSVEEASKKCVELNRQAFRKCDLRYYCYDLLDLSECFYADDLRSQLMGILNIQIDDLEDFQIPDDATDEQIDALMKMFCNLEFYYVKKVDHVE